MVKIILFILILMLLLLLLLFLFLFLLLLLIVISSSIATGAPYLKPRRSCLYGIQYSFPQRLQSPELIAHPALSCARAQFQEVESRRLVSEIPLANLQ